MKRISLTNLSITWRARLLNGALSGLALVALVALAQNRIRMVLYDAVDSAVKSQAETMLRHGPPPGFPRNGFGERDGRGRGGNDPEGRGRPGLLDFGRGFDLGRGVDFGRGRGPFGGGPEVLRFGTTALLKPRRIPLDGKAGNPMEPAWSVAGAAAARERGTDLRQERDRDGKALRVFSIRQPDFIFQTAASLEQTDAALAEIQRALTALILPVGLLMGLLGALLTDIAFAPIRKLTRAAAALQPSNLEQRLPQPGGNDTFDQLVTVLNAMLARMEAAFTRQKRFTADASHELRTPLAVIKAASSFLLENDDPLTERQRRTLSRADKTVDRANTLVSDLLLLARAENGSLPVQRESIPLQEMLSEAAQAAEAGQSAPHATVVLEVPEESFATDSKLLHRVVVNLVSNALRHTPPEGQVTLKATVQGNLTLTITDTGEGIAPEHLERLGEPFYRPDASRAREQGGVGLGLALCTEITTALGGTLEIQSAPGEGTTVTVTLNAEAEKCPV